MRFQRIFCISFLAAGWAISPAAAQFTIGPGLQVPVSLNFTRQSVFPPVTLTSSETVRIIVVNTAPAVMGNPEPKCSGSMSFAASGATPPTVGSTSFNLGAGQFAVLDLPYGKSGISTPPGEVVGQVTVNTSLPATGACSLQMSLVVFDTTSGVGHLVLSNASSQIGPIPLLH